MKKFFIYFLLFSILLIPSVVKAERIPENVDNTKKIYDYAELITEEQESEIQKQISNFIENNNLDLVIVTIDNNEEDSTIDDLKEYAKKFYNTNGFGVGENEDGIIVLVDKMAKFNDIETFGKAKEIYDSQKIKSIHNSISTFIDEENYYQMIKVYITKLTNYLKEDTDDILCNDASGNTYKCLVPKVDKKIKVYDYAELLSEEDEKKLHSIANDYINKYNMDIALVTISENPYGVSDYYSQVYAQDFYHYNGFGKGNTKDGMIILIDMSNRYIYFTTKGNAMLIYDDERRERVLDVAYDYIKDGNYFEVFKKSIEKISEYAEDGVPNSNKYYCIDEEGEYYKCKETPKQIDWGISLLIGVVGSLVPAFVHTRKYRGIKLATNANTYLKNADINVSTDQFLTTFTSRVRRSHDSGGSGGGHSGGSTISHGSGGSFSGSGRHF